MGGEMTHEEIMEMAREEGLSFVPDTNSPLARIVRKAVAKERDACAQECVEISVDYWMGDAQFEAATRCCNAIRARGQKEGA